MKFLLIPLLSIILTYELQSQHWTIEPILGVDYTSSIASKGEESELADILLKSYADNVGKANGRLGLDLGYRFSNGIGVVGGIRIARIGFCHSNFRDVRWRFGSQNNNGVFNGDTSNSPISKLQFCHNEWYIESPFRIRKEWMFNKWSVISQVGISIYYRLASETVQRTNLGISRRFDYTWDQQSNPHYKNWAIGTIAGLGLSYQYNSRLAFQSMLSGRIHWTPLYKDTPVDVRLYAIGLEMGIRIAIDGVEQQN